MKDEIKDLLQYLKNVYESEETSTWLNKLQIKDLLDYITNLQTIEQQYGAILSENAELENKITNLQDRIKQYEDPEDLTLFYMWLDEKAKDKLTNLQEKYRQTKLLKERYQIEKEDYKTRNEKVLKSLIRKQNGFGVITSVIDEINILQGKSDK